MVKMPGSAGLALAQSQRGSIRCSPCPHLFMDAALLTNWLLRGAAIGLALLLSALLWRAHRHRLAGRLGALLGLGAAAFALGTAPGFAGRLQPWQAPVLGLSAGNAMVFWLFTRALLDDGFRLQRWQIAGWATLVLLGASNCLLVRPFGLAWAQAVGASIDLATLVLAVLALAQALVQWRDDLVEARRRLRLFIVLGVGGHILLTQTMARMSGLPPAQAFSGLSNAGVLAALLGFIAWRLLQLPGQGLFAAFEPATPQPTTAPDALHPEPARSDAGPMPQAAQTVDALQAVPTPATALPEPPDPAQLARLAELMQVEQVYREENLSIGALAQRMGLPEHRLRRLINHGLGHRNFNAYLNGYRVDDVKRALADGRYDAVPILSLAMEAGFQSLGPFNRAFKAATGMTPSDFRRAARAVADSGSAQARETQASATGPV
jgi:AraC-like DNA-binding protein